MTLTMSPSMWSEDDNTLRRTPQTTENTIQYQVRGLPNGHSALIGHRPDTRPIRWHVSHQTSPDVAAGWHGDYATPEEALAALSATVSHSTY